MARSFLAHALPGKKLEEGGVQPKKKSKRREKEEKRSTVESTKSLRSFEEEAHKYPLTNEAAEREVLQVSRDSKQSTSKTV